MTSELWKHREMRDVAAEILKFIHIPGKDYVRVRVRWWNIGPHEPYCMYIDQWLTTAESYGKPTKERSKYPRSKWVDEWGRIG